MSMAVACNKKSKIAYQIPVTSNITNGTSRKKRGCTEENFRGVQGRLDVKFPLTVTEITCLSYHKCC